MTRRSMPCKVVRCRLLEVLRGSGRAKTQPNPSTSCLLMKLASCPLQILWPLRKPERAWSCLEIHSNTNPLRLNDVLIVSPYNAQVYKLTQRLPGARIGTVDKFQGQEAPVVIYSMATSSPEDAPRGMEFLYSANRLNVATSRARCACILVANPRLFEPECRTPRQMKLANAFSRYLELAKNVDSAQPCPTLAS